MSLRPMRLSLLLAHFVGVVGCADPRPILDVDRDFPDDVAVSPLDGADFDTPWPGIDHPALDAGPDDRAAPLDATADTASTDARADAPRDTRAPAPPPREPSDPCAPEALLTVERDGEVSGRSTRFRFNNAASREHTWLQPPPACAGRTVHPVVVLYTLRSTARLVVSTFALPRPGDPVDTVVWVLDRCAPGAIVRDCNDDSLAAATFQPGKSMLSTQAVYPVGTTVAVAVATTRGTIGDVELFLTELSPLRREGENCRELETEVSCEAGTSCVSPRQLARSPDGVCTALGHDQGACRTVGRPCDDGLGCDDDVWNPLARCRPLRPRGSSCTILLPHGRSDAVCDGACAQTDEGPRCRGVGERAGPCHGDGRCDAGLQCSTLQDDRTRRCTATLPPDAACTLDDPWDACSEGQRCVAEPVGTVPNGRCRTVGALRARCRADGGCDAGLQCVPWRGRDRCMPRARVGEPCHDLGVDSGCEDGSSCVLHPTVVCLRDGVDGGRCRRSSQPCDEGLQCNAWPSDPMARCVRPLVGAAECVPRPYETPCEAGRTCAGVIRYFRCLPPGSEGGHCRWGRTLCDPGLACNGFGHCERQQLVGEACNGQSEFNACVDRGRCGAMLSSSACADAGVCPYVCLPPGVEQGACRWGIPVCDPGLFCTSGRIYGAIGMCRRPVVQ